MYINHVHFYVTNAEVYRNWFVDVLGFAAVAQTQDGCTHTEVVQSGSIYFLLSSPLQASSPVAQFLQTHPPGVVDVGFCVQDIESVLSHAIAQGVQVRQPLESHPYPQGRLRSAQISAWGTLNHTLIERSGTTPLLPNLDLPMDLPDQKPGSAASFFLGIDHVVLNVAIGELERATTWYSQIFGLQPQQQFTITTDRSALRSVVMGHSDQGVQLPINEPASTHSQIQEFLDVNCGPGIQHIALQTSQIPQVIAQLRDAGLDFISVPPTYYDQLQQRSGFQRVQADWAAIQAQEILVDWQDQASPALLLQTFTQPIFEQPTFFFELIERQAYAEQGCLQRVQGFGEGNFQALVEAIEQEQIKRGSLPTESINPKVQ